LRQHGKRTARLQDRFRGQGIGRDAMPNKKVGAGALAGALSVILAGVIKQFAGVELSAEVGMAVTTVMTFLVSYFVSE
jgi:hypothetical protein